MSKRATVTSAPRAVCNRIRMCTTADARILLEGLRAAYQSLGREEQQQVKGLLLTLSKNNVDLLCQERERESKATS